MRTRHHAEVRKAVLNAIRPCDSLISRFQIEDEIDRYPERYTELTGRSRKGRRRIITLAMNAMFIVWSQSWGVRPSSFVWEVRDQEGHIHDHPEVRR